MKSRLEKAILEYSSIPFQPKAPKYRGKKEEHCHSISASFREPNPLNLFFNFISTHNNHSNKTTKSRCPRVIKYRNIMSCILCMKRLTQFDIHYHFYRLDWLCSLSHDLMPILSTMSLEKPNIKCKNNQRCDLKFEPLIAFYCQNYQKINEVYY